MASLDVCPICDSLVYTSNTDFSCCNCETSFSRPSEGVILVNRVGVIMGKMVNGYHEIFSQIRKGRDTSCFPYNLL
jgi:hypothetical protein